MGPDYIYAAARVRSLETALLTKSDMDQLLSAKDYETALGLVRSNGWGGSSSSSMDEDAILDHETEKTWATIRDLIGDNDVMDVIRLPRRYHNLKAAIKAAVDGKPEGEIFYDGTGIEPDDLIDIIRKGNTDKLPVQMQKCSEEAFKSFAHTGNGQMSDCLIDAACLEDMASRAAKTDVALVREYAEFYVASADIRIAARCAATQRPKEFIARSLVSCTGLDKDKLMNSALSGTPALYAYLVETPYANAVPELKKGSAAFERWVDNKMIKIISSGKTDSFTAGAIAAYAVARQTEIKNVRIILSGKRNGISDELIAERIRDTYV